MIDASYRLVSDRPALIAAEIALFKLPLARVADMKRGEIYLSFNGRWATWRMGINYVPRLCGYFPDIHSAIFRARRSV